MDRLIWWLLSLVTLYDFIPGFISRVFGFRVFRRGKAEKEIAITFDDGPDPVYTPQLLDLLKKHDAKATFFVVGENAENNPEIIRRMYEEGHSLGIHNYVHRSNWIMSPRTVKKQVQRTSDVLFEITGRRPIYYRPPWGILNLFDYRQLRHYQIVLWSGMFGDWKEKAGVGKLYHKMRRQLAPGEVFVLHDCGRTFGADENAPANMIAALARILEDGDRMGLRYVGIGELMEITETMKDEEKEQRAKEKGKHGEGNGRKLGFLKKIVVSLFMLWEKLFHLVFRLKPIASGDFMHYRIIRYNGDELQLQDGGRLKRGDKLLEMHFNNERMFELGMNAKSSVQIAIKIIREVQKALPDVAREIKRIDLAGEIKGTYGISTINRGADGLGFETFALPDGLFSKMTNWYLKLLMSIIHPEGGGRVRKHEEKLEPRIIVMPRERVLAWENGKPAEVSEAYHSKRPAVSARE
ncbi:polysaccharide deacetylase family protein [Cohnella sp. AR92]|uniref:polysaccharide deacetylase family protein n=1 Tax=Cohnella sp. AR92 TaxID=648716 RepID=UPI000F8F20F0|nr:polysaccharide deacetylase family protein [Cohnella sp. AR92]RUS48630.1 polysaccharide deacetylase family protein [Cohnella sp. AR92]